MTESEAEKVVKTILDLRLKGLKENEEFYAPMKELHNFSEEDTDWAIEMVSTGAFRAGIISKGGQFPPFMKNIDFDPILAAAFRLAWIDFKGEQHYKINWLGEKPRKGFWSFLKSKK